MKIHSKVMKLAHAIKAQFANFAQALVHAWKTVKLMVKMAIKDVPFTYKKVNGDLRQAIGTLNFEYTNTSGRTSPADSLVYFDRDANGLRSCKIVNLIF